MLGLQLEEHWREAEGRNAGSGVNQGGFPERGSLSGWV